MKIINTTANITYNGNTGNMPVRVEYKHTGKQFCHSFNHFTSDPEIAERWKQEGKKVTESPGYWFISRIAIPTVLADGKKDWWYITNEGDSYHVNKASKYWQTKHRQLIQQQPA